MRGIKVMFNLLIRMKEATVIKKIFIIENIKIYKNENGFIVNIDALKKYKYLGVIIDRKTREKNPEVWNNLMAVGVL
jgi:hypothetical protein